MNVYLVEKNPKSGSRNNRKKVFMKDIGETYYNGNYHKELHHHLVENDEYFSARAHASQKRLLKYIELENRKLLDYGCGIGQNIFGIEGAAGYDISSFAREQCTRRV